MLQSTSSSKWLLRRAVVFGVFVAAALIGLPIAVESHPLNLKPNRNWFCVGCSVATEEYENHMFGVIRAAIMRDPRITYLNLDMSWLDRLLDTDTKVKVHRLHPKQISEYYVMPKPTVLPRSCSEEMFELAYTEIPRAEEESAAGNNFKPDDVDRFLLHNPCWIPLHEPVYNFTTYPILLSMGGETTNATTTKHRSSSSGSSRRTGAHKQQQHQDQQQRHKYVIFARLPIYGFHATCRLYSQVTKHQFPSICHYSANNMSVHFLGNIGWSNTVNGMLFKFVEVFSKKTYPNKVFVIPRASSFRERERWAQEKNGNGSIFKLGGGWAWAEPATCDPDIEFYNPWSCNFIPLSNCTDRHTRVLLHQPPYPQETADQNYNTPEVVFEPGFGADTDAAIASFDKSMTLDKLRVVYEDANKHDNSQWTYTRFYAFIMRPNARMRFLIRRSLRKVGPVATAAVLSKKQQQQLQSHSSSSSGSSGVDGSSNRQQAAHTIISSSAATATATAIAIAGGVTSAPFALLGGMRLPCIAMHIRHGDALQDHRGQLKIDRSLHSHVTHSRNLTEGLGIANIYIASDNRTAIARAAIEYPQYNWFTQQRPIKDNLAFFEVKNEDDIQIELSHVLTDLRVAGQCHGMIGTFDSGITEQMIVTGCALSPTGACPPSVDLREVYRYNK